MNVLALGTGLGPSEVNTVGGLRGDFAPVNLARRPRETPVILLWGLIILG